MKAGMVARPPRSTCPAGDDAGGIVCADVGRDVLDDDRAAVIADADLGLEAQFGPAARRDYGRLAAVVLDVLGRRWPRPGLRAAREGPGGARTRSE
jgi:hypothetical protein